MFYIFHFFLMWQYNSSYLMPFPARSYFSYASFITLLPHRILPTCVSHYTGIKFHSLNSYTETPHPVPPSFKSPGGTFLSPVLLLPIFSITLTDPPPQSSYRAASIHRYFAIFYPPDFSPSTRSPIIAVTFLFYVSFLLRINLTFVISCILEAA